MHLAAHSNLPMDLAATGGISQSRCSCDHHSPDLAARPQRFSHPATQSIQPEGLMKVKSSQSSTVSTDSKVAIEARHLNIYYHDFMAVKDVNISIERQKITAIIGPSGCGKSTMLRSFNRMNELVPTSRTEGEVLFHGTNIYQSNIDPVAVRRYIGMVFQKPNPFPKSIYKNVAWGARINGFKGSKTELDEMVENALRSEIGRAHV